MTGQKQSESDNSQSEKFRKKVQELIDAGELSPTEAKAEFERAMRQVASTAAKGRSNPPSDEKK